jgi:hypothetical protein
MTTSNLQPQPSAGSQLPIEMLKEKENILWEELRGLRDIALKMLQWGVTALASLETALFFLRKDVAEKMLATKQLQIGEYLPLGLYFRGTIFLLMVAMIFSFLLLLTGNRYKKIRAQLVAVNLYGIQHGEVNKSSRWVVCLVFIAFPVLDALIRLSL